jgi:hypothetical protein
MPACTRLRQHTHHPPAAPCTCAASNAVTDCTGETGEVYCSDDGIPLGLCCTPDTIDSKQCTEAQLGTCGEYSKRGAMVPLCLLPLCAACNLTQNCT